MLKKGPQLVPQVDGGRFTGFSPQGTVKKRMKVSRFGVLNFFSSQTKDSTNLFALETAHSQCSAPDTTQAQVSMGAQLVSTAGVLPQIIFPSVFCSYIAKMLQAHH